MTTDAPNLAQILKLEVPIVVRLGERIMDVSDVLGLVPGAIIELPKNAESELDLHAGCKASPALGPGVWENAAPGVKRTETRSSGELARKQRTTGAW